MTAMWTERVQARARRDAPPAVTADPAAGRAGGVSRIVVHCAGDPTPARDVTAVLARPTARAAAGSPAVVLLHGGGGRAEPRWARSWAARGHTALALDLAAPQPFTGEARAVTGQVRPARLDHAGIFDAVAEGTEHSWLHQAVEAAVDAVTVLRSRPGVDPRRVGVCGISWGGYVAVLMASIDPRLRYAVNVYAAGFLARESAWRTLLQDLPAATARRWIDAFDLARYVHRVTAPTLWLTGTGDPCFPLDAFDATAARAGGPVTRRIVPGLGHGHEPAWTLTEPYDFGAAAFADGPGLPVVCALPPTGAQLRAEVESAVPVLEAALHHTSDAGAWATRRWRSSAAPVDGTTVRADVPADGFSAAFISVRTAAGTSTTGLMTGCAAGTGRRPKGDPLWYVVRNRAW